VVANDLGWLDAVALRDLIAAGEVTPAEASEGVIARIEAADPVLNAVVVPLPDTGRAIAADPELPHGPFYGGRSSTTPARSTRNSKNGRPTTTAIGRTVASSANPLRQTATKDPGPLCHRPSSVPHH
jgi:hypothetical protein